VFRAVVLAEGDEIGINEFPQIATQLARKSGTGPANEERAAHPSEPSPPAAPAMPDLMSPPNGLMLPNGLSPATLQLTDPAGEVRPLEEVETEVIRFAINHYRGQMSEVARRLRIGRSTLYRKLDGLGLSPDMPEAQNRETVPGVVTG